MNEKILLGARILVVVGIVVMAGGVFINTNNVAQFSTAKANLEAYKQEVEEKYTMDKPVAPVDYSLSLVAPAKPAAGAEEGDKALYEERLEKYNDMKTQEKESYKFAQEGYKKALSEYNYQLTLLSFKKVKEAESDKKKIEGIQENIIQHQISAGQVSLTVLFRFIGVILLLLGAAGILIYADVMEKLGVLVMLGFAFKTIIGL